MGPSRKPERPVFSQRGSYNLGPDHFVFRDEYYQQKMTEQFEELAQLKDEKEKLLVIQGQLQELHDRFQEVPTYMYPFHEVLTYMYPFQEVLTYMYPSNSNNRPEIWPI